MFTIKTFIRSVLFILFCYSCGTPQPARRNVLNRPAPSKQPAKQAPVNQPSQTVFKRPEQITRNTNQPSVPTKREEPNVVIERREEPEISNTSNNESPTYRSPEYYKNLLDPLQQSTAKPTYYKKAEQIAKQVTATPSSKNPAINANEWYTTVNFDVRKPLFVVLHHTAQNSAEQTLYTFSVPHSGVSAHYVVGRNGVVHQMLNDYMRAWHAGKSKWGNIYDMNSCSIGIEIDNNGSEVFSDEQINALLKLLDYLKDEYGIPQSNFIGHSDIAPGRKSDPSKYFPWKKLAEHGFGYWYDPNNMLEPPPDFNAILALRVIGYDTRDQAKAISAFKLHYVQTDTSSFLTPWDKKILYNIYRKY